MTEKRYQLQIGIAILKEEYKSHELAEKELRWWKNRFPWREMEIIEKEVEKKS